MLHVRGGLKMGQIEVYEYLKALRNVGYDEYLSMADIISAMKEMGCNDGEWGVRSSVLKLEKYGYVEKLFDYQFGKKSRMLFRLKCKYIDLDNRGEKTIYV